MDKQVKQNILRGSAATSIGTITGMVFQFLTVVIMTRYVTKEEFGIYVLVMVIVNMFNILGGLGLDLTMVKFLSSDKKRGESRSSFTCTHAKGIWFCSLQPYFYFYSPICCTFF